MSKKIQISHFGSERTTVEVADDAVWRDVKDTIDGADSKYVCIQGEPLNDYLEEPVQEDVTVFVAPKKIAQGQMIDLMRFMPKGWDFSELTTY